MLWEDSSGRICRSPTDVGRKSRILNVAGKALRDPSPFASPVSSPCSCRPLWFPQPGDGGTALLPASPTPFHSQLISTSYFTTQLNVTSSGRTSLATKHRFHFLRIYHLSQWWNLQFTMSLCLLLVRKMRLKEVFFPLPHSKRQKKEVSKLRPRKVFIPE